jgi:hypothetical protein
MWTATFVYRFLLNEALHHQELREASLAGDERCSMTQLNGSESSYYLVVARQLAHHLRRYAAKATSTFPHANIVPLCAAYCKASLRAANHAVWSIYICGRPASLCTRCIILEAPPVYSGAVI